jgi:hypothetical protein
VRNGSCLRTAANAEAPSPLLLHSHFFSRKISPPAVTRCSSSAEPPGWSLVLREKRGNWCDGRHSSSHRSSLAHSLTRPLTTRHSVCLSRYVSSLIRALAASSLTRDRVHVFASLTHSVSAASLTPSLPHSLTLRWLSARCLPPSLTLASVEARFIQLSAVQFSSVHCECECIVSASVKSGPVQCSRTL